ncbi:MAG: restriction system-associated AAA family ATPase [Desulfobacteraceae bacterium]|jgi:restriction system-associated AAA family ATPase
MKLLRLKIGEPFRCLQAGFELHFLNEWDRKERAGRFDPYILAGPNGCGKSNILEVLAAIFFQLECQYLSFRPEALMPPEFDEGFDDGFAGRQGIAAHRPQAFELEYLLPVPRRLQSDPAAAIAHVKISKKAGDSAKVFWVNHPEYGEDTPLSRLVAWDLLPEFVLGYSSGENEILSLPFFKQRFIQLDEYLDSLKENTSYAGKPESRQAFLDNAFNQAILVSNLLFQQLDALEPFRQEVGVEGLVQFRIILKKSIEIAADQADAYPQEYVRVEEEEDGIQTYRLLLLQRFDAVDDEKMARTAVIDRLQRCATSSYHDSITDTLYLDYLVTDETRKAFQNNFSSAMDLFQHLQILLILNLYAVSEPLKRDLYLSDSLYVNETVPTLPADARVMRFEDLVLKKSGVDEPIYARSLSDGEYQFLHSLGLCLLYRDTNSLFLLDEPETHFNPDWRSQFITRLRECFKSGDPKVRREVLITTHTPFLISDSLPEQVLVIDKSDGVVKVTRPDYNTLGASINKITMKTFGKRETIGGFAQQKLEELKQRFEAAKAEASDAEKSALIDEIDRQLGDSVEKVLLIKTILDSMEGSPD